MRLFGLLLDPEGLVQLQPRLGQPGLEEGGLHLRVIGADLAVLRGPRAHGTSRRVIRDRIRAPGGKRPPVAIGHTGRAAIRDATRGRFGRGGGGLCGIGAGADRGGIGLGRRATSGELGIGLQPPRQIDAVATGIRHQKGRHGTPYAVVAAGDVAPARVQGLGPLAQHVQGEVEAVGKRRPGLLVRVTDVQPPGTGGHLLFPSLFERDGFQHRRDHEVMEARLVEAHEGAVRQGPYRGIADPARDQGLFAEAFSRPELGQFIPLLAVRETALHLAQPFFDHVAGVRGLSLFDDAVAGLDLDGLYGGEQALDIGHRQAGEDRGLQHAGDPVFRAARCDFPLEGLGVAIIRPRMQVVMEPLPLHAQHLDLGPRERR